MKANKDKLFTAKVDENLLKAFKHACENQDTTASQAVRAFMRDYVRNMGKPSFLTKNHSSVALTLWAWHMIS